MNSRQKEAYRSIRFRLVNYINRAASIYYVEVEEGWWIFKKWRRFHNYKHGGILTTGGNQYSTMEVALWELAAEYGLKNKYTYCGTLIKTDDFEVLLSTLSTNQK